MAARAATSVYATLGVAAATLVAVGAIIAGPSILDCSKDSAGFGACLRDKLGESTLTSPDVSSAPTPPAGWMEAVANEYEPPLSSPVELEGTPADLLAAAPSPSIETTQVAIAPAAELATLAPAQEEVPVSVALVGPEGALSASLAQPAPSPGVTTVLSQLADGLLSADTPSQPAIDVAVAVEPIDPADVTSAVEQPPSEPAPVELSAEPQPSQPVPSSEPEPPAPSSSEPPVVIEFNPSFPNVIVLPPPPTGDDSSFRSLQLN